jgi:hypothetical protein
MNNAYEKQCSEQTYQIGVARYEIRPIVAEGAETVRIRQAGFAERQAKRERETVRPNERRELEESRM